MPHVDSEQLTLIALGEPVDPDDVAVHLAECETCRDEVAALRETVAIARDVPAVPGGSAAGPPGHVWAGIAAELGLAGTGGAAPREPQPEAVAARRRAWLRPVLALAAAAAIGAGVTVVGLHPWTGTPANPVISAATLGPLPTGPRDVTGAVTIRSGPGGPVLTIDARGLPLREGYYEVWLFDPDANKMVAVGDLGATSSGEYRLPPTLNLRAYHVVDISAEAYDGVQTHSTVSVLRGTLTN